MTCEDSAKRVFRAMNWSDTSVAMTWKQRFRLDFNYLLRCVFGSSEAPSRRVKSLNEFTAINFI